MIMNIPGFRLALAIARLAGMTVESFIPPRRQAIRLKIRSSKSETNRTTQSRITDSKIRNELVWNWAFLIIGIVSKVGFVSFGLSQSEPGAKESMPDLRS